MRLKRDDRRHQKGRGLDIHREVVVVAGFLRKESVWNNVLARSLYENVTVLLGFNKKNVLPGIESH